PTLTSIAGEKAGILKPGVPAVIARQHPESERAILSHTEAPLIWTRDWPVEDLELTAHFSRFRVCGVGVECPLAGEHQVDNALTAAVALRQLGAPPDGIAATVWPARLERVRAAPEIVLDGAHNPAGVDALASYIERFYFGRR